MTALNNPLTSITLEVDLGKALGLKDAEEFSRLAKKAGKSAEEFLVQAALEKLEREK